MTGRKREQRKWHAQTSKQLRGHVQLSPRSDLRGGTNKTVTEDTPLHCDAVRVKPVVRMGVPMALRNVTSYDGCSVFFAASSSFSCDIVSRYLRARTTCEDAEPTWQASKSRVSPVHPVSRQPTKQLSRVRAKLQPGAPGRRRRNWQRKVKPSQAVATIPKRTWTGTPSTAQCTCQTQECSSPKGCRPR